MHKRHGYLGFRKEHVVLCLNVRLIVEAVGLHPRRRESQGICDETPRDTALHRRQRFRYLRFLRLSRPVTPHSKSTSQSISPQGNSVRVLHNDASLLFDAARNSSSTQLFLADLNGRSLLGLSTSGCALRACTRSSYVSSEAVLARVMHHYMND